MANKDVEFEEDIIDLTELIESGDRGDGRTPQQQSRAPADDDFSALLEEKTAAGNFDPDEQLDMSGMGGIDNLLESLDIPPQPREGAKQAATPPGDELDSVLDDLLAAAPPKQAAPAMPELDMPPPQPAPARSAPAPEAGGHDADLDDLLSSFDEPPRKKAAPDPELGDLLGDVGAPAAAKKTTAPDDGLDDLLGETAAPAPPNAAAPDSELDSLLGDMDIVGASEEHAAHEDPGLAADLDDILGEVELPSPPESAPPPMEEPPAPEPVEAPAPEAEAEAAQDLLADIDGEEETASEQEALLEPEPEPEPPVADKIAEPEQGGAADMEGKEELDDLLGSDRAIGPESTDLPPLQPAAEHALTEAPQGNQPVPVQAVTWTPEALIGICHNLASGESAQQSLQKFSRELGQQSAHVEDMGDQLTQLGKRMLACESKLSAARARIASLEKSLESTAALEDLLRQGTPLHTGFMALISAAVSNSLKGFALPGPDTAIQKHVARLEASVENADNRLKALEERLSRLEQAMPQGTDLEDEIAKLITSNENSDVRIRTLEKKVKELVAESSEKMEKAAAACVARILQEEISKLIQE